MCGQRRLTREALFEALWARRCFATNGARVMLDVQVNGMPMGSEVEVAGQVHLMCRVQASRMVQQVALFRDGVQVLAQGVWKATGRFEV